jgi:hypothetical protein
LYFVQILVFMVHTVTEKLSVCAFSCAAASVAACGRHLLCTVQWRRVHVRLHTWRQAHQYGCCTTSLIVLSAACVHVRPAHMARGASVYVAAVRHPPYYCCQRRVISCSLHTWRGGASGVYGCWACVVAFMYRLAHIWRTGRRTCLRSPTLIARALIKL